jgi:hypothetical protein
MGGFKHGGLPMSRWFHVPIALVLFATAATAAPRVKAKPAAPTFFPTAVGTTWVYRDGNRRVTEIIVGCEERADGKLIAVVNLEGWKPVSRSQLLVTRRGLFLASSGPIVFDPPPCLFKADAAAGVSWGNTDCNVYALRQEFQTGQRAAVEVPAGQFYATPVERKDAEFGSESIGWRMWYSPGVGVVKFECGSRGRVLVAFRLGRE